MEESFLKKMELLNNLWERVKVIPEIVELAHRITMAEFDLSEVYGSPFNEGYKLAEVVDEIEENLIKFVITRTTAGLNLRVNFYDVHSKFKGSFDAVKVAEYIEKEYLTRADDLAFQELLENARELIPYSIRDEKDPQAALAEIHKKNRLVLRHHILWDLTTPYTHDFLTRATALEKLAKVVLWGHSPSTVRAYGVQNAYWYDSSTGEVLQKKEIFNSPIVAVKVYRNGKALFWFASEDDARKVAEVLVHGRRKSEN